MTAPNPDLDAWFAKARTWHDERARLRFTLLDCGLAEALKWGKPTYTHEGTNIVLIMPMKENCALLFMKGTLLKDPNGLLIHPGENSQSARQMRFTSVADIARLEKSIQSYVKQAIDAEKAGLKVAFKKSSELVYLEGIPGQLARNSVSDQPRHLD